jgi:hypothetical protein
VFRSGAASWKCDSTVSNNTASITAPTPTFTDGRSYWARIYLNAAAAPTTAAAVLLLGGSSVTQIVARLRTDGALELLVNNVVQGSPSATINDGTWHRVELKGVATATTTWTAAELLLDGTSVATWSGSVARTNGVGFGWLGSPGASLVINADDYALNDSTGSVNNGYPGSGKVVLLKPISDSAVGTGWTNSAGTGTSLFDCVDNTPPTGIADTTSSAGHQIRNATSNANVNYDANMTSYTTAGIAAADTVNCVIPWCVTGAPVTTSAKQGTVGVASNPAITNIALSATGTSGAFWAGFAASTYGGGWKYSSGTITEAPVVTLGTSPVMRITQVTSSTRIAICCSMGIYVDYTPASTVRFPRNPAIDFADPAFV